MPHENVEADVARVTGLRAVGARVFGRYQGHPAAITFETGHPHLIQLKVPRRSASGLAAAIQDPNLLTALDVPAGTVSIDTDLRLLDHDLQSPATDMSAVEIKDRLDGLVSLAQRAGAGLSDKCSECEARPGSPMVINGDVDQLCEACYQELIGRYQRGDGTPLIKPNIMRGVLFGLAGVLVLGLLWGQLGEAFGRRAGFVAWILGFIFGPLIALMVVKGARILTAPILVLAFVLTALTFILGLAYWAYLELKRNGAPLDQRPSQFVAVASGGGGAVGLFLGLLAAWRITARLEGLQVQRPITFEVVR